MELALKKILIIGSEGFIGKHIVNELSNNGFDVFGVDLLDIYPQKYHYYKIGRLNPEFGEIFRSHHFEYCINAAGSGSVSASIAEPYRDFEANVIDTFQVLNSMRINNHSCKYLHISSAAIYGNPIRLPIVESDQIDPVSPYGYHKWVSEIVCKEFCTLHNISIAILRPFSAYGPGLKKQLFWDLFQKYKKDKTVILHGSGNETRDFIYIEDIVSAVRLIIDKNQFFGEAFNVASGRSTSIKNVVEIFKDCTQTDCEFIFDNTPDIGNPKCWEADISKISEIGFTPLFTLNRGLQCTIDWLKKNG